MAQEGWVPAVPVDAAEAQAWDEETVSAVLDTAAEDAAREQEARP